MTGMRPRVRLSRLSDQGMELFGASGRAIIPIGEISISLDQESPTWAINGASGLDPRFTKLSDKAKAFAKAKLLGDPQMIERTLYFAWDRAVELALEHGWRYGRDLAGREIFRNASRIALAEHLDSAVWRACPWCKGSGSRSLGVSCKNCEGMGRRDTTPEQLIKLLRIDQQQYSQHWQPKVIAIGAAIEVWEQEALFHLYCQAIDGLAVGS